MSKILRAIAERKIEPEKLNIKQEASYCQINLQEATDPTGWDGLSLHRARNPSTQPTADSSRLEKGILWPTLMYQCYPSPEMPRS